MSETTPPTPNTPSAADTCELLVDYVYGELDEARKRTFEEHLPACARCRQQAASFGRVRTAVKRVMPDVEPPAQLAGPLHAQLMHAAAQHKPRRGLLLAFPRKIVQHPALSAAAMFVLVGGAIAINWSRGQLAMPTAEHVAEAPKPVETAANTPAPPSAAEALPAPEEEKQAASLGKKGADKSPAEGSTKIALETPSGRLDVQRPAKRRSVADDRKAGKLDDALAAKDEDANQVGGVTGGVSGGAAGELAGGGVGGAAHGAVAQTAKSSAPGDLVRNRESEQAPARDYRQSQRYAPNVPTTVSPQPSSMAASSPAASSPPPAERDGYVSRGQAQAAPAAPLQKPTAAPRNFDGLRKQANEYAKTGRCDEAIKQYQELERAAQYISPTDRVNWVRCLAQRGRQEEAQQQLDELKAQKRVTNAQIQDVEKELNDSRRRAEPKKAEKAEKAKEAKKAPAVDSSASQQQQRQQRPADATAAPAAPPDPASSKARKPAL
jgi:hypothetical protein